MIDTDTYKHRFSDIHMSKNQRYFRGPRLDCAKEVKGRAFFFFALAILPPSFKFMLSLAKEVGGHPRDSNSAHGRI